MQPNEDANEVQLVVITQQPTSACYTNMRSNMAKQLFVLGTLQTIIGVLCIIFQALSLGITLSYELFSLAFVGDGFWLGALFILTGPFGIVGGMKKKRSHVIAFNVLSIVSASVCLVLIVLAAVSALFYNTNRPHMPDMTASRDTDAGIAMESMKAILGLLEAIFAIWSSVVCCSVGACCCDSAGCCCYPPSTTQTQQPFAIVAHGQSQVSAIQQMPILMNNQQMMYLAPGQQPMINFRTNQQDAQFSPQQLNLSQIQQDDYTESNKEVDTKKYKGGYTRLKNETS